MSNQNDGIVTGQLVFRDKGDAPDGSDRKLFMVVGVLAVPRDHFIKGEHRYVLDGHDEDLVLHQASAKDVSARTIGNSASGILCAPMWQI